MTGPSRWCKVEVRLAIYLRDHFTCMYCGRDMTNCKRGEIGLDHLIPRSVLAEMPPYTSPLSSELHAPDNLVTACRPCNSRRGNRPWRHYAPGGAQERIESALCRPLNLELAGELLEGYGPKWEAW